MGPSLAVGSLLPPWLQWGRILSGLEQKDGPSYSSEPKKLEYLVHSCTSQSISETVTGTSLELGLGALRRKPLSSACADLFYFFVLFLASKYWLALASALWLTWSLSYSCREVRPMVDKWHSGNWARWRGSFFHQVCKIQFSNKGYHHVSTFSAEYLLPSGDTFFLYKRRLLHFK